LSSSESSGESVKNENRQTEHVERKWKESGSISRKFDFHWKVYMFLEVGNEYPGYMMMKQDTQRPLAHC
jgi:hypothetical protein